MTLENLLTSDDPEGTDVIVQHKEDGHREAAVVTEEGIVRKRNYSGTHRPSYSNGTYEIAEVKDE